MRDFAFMQAFEFYKENYKIQKKGENIYFEQDRASCSISKKIKSLLKNICGDKLILKLLSFPNHYLSN